MQIQGVIIRYVAGSPRGPGGLIECRLGQAVTVLHPHQVLRTSQHVKPLWADSGAMRCINLEEIETNPGSMIIDLFIPLLLHRGNNHSH
jgi:hypothetical protein